MKALIIGASGQDGFFLKRLLEDRGIETIAVARSAGFTHLDLSDFILVREFLAKEQPDYIFHLAANSSTNHLYWQENFTAITLGTQHLLEAVFQLSPPAKVFISGSGLQFKNSGAPIHEDDPSEERDFYSLCRVQSVLAARYYRQLAVKVYVGYFFNHDSERRTAQHLNRKICDAAVRIARGSNEKLVIGDTEVVKEFGYAAEIMEALWIFIQQDVIVECNLATGIGHSVADWLQACFSLLGLHWSDYVEPSEDYISPYRKLVADNGRIRSLGWAPSVGIHELAKIMMNAHAG